jgi:hypothetical protein
MLPRQPLPKELTDRAFSVRTARQAGIGANRLRGTDLATPFSGVRMAGPAPASQAERAIAYLPRLSSHAFFSHTTAAHLWGLPLPLRFSASPTIDVSVQWGRVRPAGHGVSGHHLRIDGRDVLESASSGVRLTSLARTWCDLGALLSEEELVAAGDFLLWHRRPDALRQTADDLARTLARFEGRRGRPLLHGCLPLLSDRADSPAESTMRMRFLRAGLPIPQVNADIFDPDHNWIAMVDLAWPEHSVAFDYEGDHHRTDRAQWTKDLVRARRVDEAGWKYVRAGGADLTDTAPLINSLRRLLGVRP